MVRRYTTTMKRIAAVAFLFVALSAFAGVTYDFRSETTGVQPMSLRGTIATEGPLLRMTVISGDGMMFKSGSVVMSNDGGKHLTVFDSSSKTYYQLPMAELLSGAADAITSNPMLQVTFGQPKVFTRDAGDGGKLEGYPTRKTVVDASI